MINQLREFIYRRYNISFSKSGDDLQLKKLIGVPGPGTYVDVGCWHPVKASNTYLFYLRGWRGICIDPNPELVPLYRKFRPRDVFINNGIGPAGNTLDYYMLDDAFSSMNTFDRAFLEGHDLIGRVRKQERISLRRLDEILDQQLRPGERLDFFDIDVEGLDLEVLQTNDWERFRPKIIAIETNETLERAGSSDTVVYLKEKGYQLVAKTVIKGNLGNLFLIDQNAV